MYRKYAKKAKDSKNLKDTKKVKIVQNNAKKRQNMLKLHMHNIKYGRI